MNPIVIASLSLSLWVVACAASAGPDVILATFNKTTTFEWATKNDPVMGGGSTSSFVVVNNTGVFDGTCAIVKYLGAPGFASVHTGGAAGAKGFNDVSSAVNGTVDLMVRSSTPAYKGFKVGWSAPGIPVKPEFGRGAGSFKASFQLKNQSGWQLVQVPMTDFSDDWSPYTGNCNSKDPIPIIGKQHHCCGSGTDAQYCPTTTFLSSLTDLSIWAEGVAGQFHVEVKWIGASK